MRPTPECHLCPPLLFDEFLGTLDLFVELLDLLVMAEAQLVIGVELEALTDFAGEDGRGRNVSRFRRSGAAVLVGDMLASSGSLQWVYFFLSTDFVMSSIGH